VKSTKRRGELGIVTTRTAPRNKAPGVRVSHRLEHPNYQETMLRSGGGAPPRAWMSSSKRRQSPYGESTSPGRCCAHSTCARVGKQSFVNLLQDDVFPTPCEGVGGEAEGRLDSGTGVGLAAAARHTYTHTNTHAQVEEHQGHDDHTRPSRANNFSTAVDKLLS